MQGKKQRERYRRLDRAERAAIQSGLDKGRSCRQMARDLGRSPSTVADEVARNRTVSKGPGKGERVRDAPEDACPKLLSWPRCCNGCRNLRYRSCSRRWRCEYSAARAQALADAELRVFFTTTKFRISRLISFGFHRFAKVPHPFFANCPIFPSSRLPRTFCSARRTQPADHDA